MSLGLYDYDRRRRRRVWGRLIRFGFFLLLLGGIAVFAYQAGIERRIAREAGLQENIDELNGALAEVQHYAAGLEGELQEARDQYDALNQRYEAEVPTGVLRGLVEQVAGRLDDGTDPGRLSFYIDSAGPPHDCSEPATRSFFMATPLWNGPNTSAAFADGRIIVTGLGENALDAGGQAQPEFDPTQDVTLTFTTIDGEETSVAGRLPLQHALVMGDREYRFSVTEGLTSMVDVTADSCPFP